MRRRDFMVALAGGWVAWPFATHAQPSSSMPQVGFLGIEAPEGPHPELDAFLDGLRAFGHLDGRNISVVRRLTGKHRNLLPRYAAELVALKVKVIVAFSPAVGAAVRATHTIPIVIRTTLDPVKAGYVRNLARPSGNVTGVSTYSDRLWGKRLELLRDLVPNLASVGVLWNDRSPSGPAYFQAIGAAAETLGVKIVSLVVRESADIDRAFAAAARAQVGGLVPLRDPVVVSGRARIAELAAAGRLPAIYDDRRFCDVGGLASYGADLSAAHRRTAYYVDRILNGAIPADLPIEEPAKFDLVISFKAAKALGLDIPKSILVRADEVIE